MTTQTDQTSHRLRGAVSVVTGGAHGIGRACAQRLARDGSKVAICDIDGAAAEEAVRSLSEQGFDALAVEVDIADAASVTAMVASAIARFGRIDILVNCAAMFESVPMSRVPFDQIDEDEWDRLMQVNLKGAWLVCRGVIPYMRRNGYGKVINIGSASALTGSTTRIHYVTSKAGMLGFTRTLAREVGGDGVRVNCVMPGSTVSEESPSDATLARRGRAVAQRALGRLEVPGDIAGAVSFFASRDSDFVTGQSLVVDGGKFMQ